MATNFGKICEMTFFQQAGISQWIRISQFRFTCVKATFCAILVKISPLTPEITQGIFVSFGTRRQKSAHHTKYLSKYWTGLHQLFSIGELMYADYKTEIIFAVVEQTLLCHNVHRRSSIDCMEQSEHGVIDQLRRRATSNA